jgi:fatty acid desaturase
MMLGMSATTEPSPAELITAHPRYDRNRVSDALRPLYELSHARAAFGIAWCWAWIVAALAFARWSQHGAGYALAFVIIAGRQVALFFVVHEAAHQRVFSDRDWSDRIVNVLCGYPVGVCVAFYRHHHLQHHRNLNTAADPDWQLHQNEFWRWPRSRPATMQALGRSLLGFNARKWLAVFQLSPWQRFKQLSNFDRMTFVVFAVGLGLLLWCGHGFGLFLGLWLLPMFTLTFFLHHLRGIAEHIALHDTHELNATRTVVSSPLERFLLAPMGVNYHLEHHLFPGVPAYRLGTAHALLMSDPEYQRHAHITRSYLGWRRGLLAEITANQEPSVAATR